MTRADAGHDQDAQVEGAADGGGVAPRLLLAGEVLALVVRRGLVVLSRGDGRRGVDRLGDGVERRLDLRVVVGVGYRAEVRHEDPD